MTEHKARWNEESEDGRTREAAHLYHPSEQVCTVVPPLERAAEPGCQVALVQNGILVNLEKGRAFHFSLLDRFLLTGPHRWLKSTGLLVVTEARRPLGVFQVTQRSVDPWPPFPLLDGSIATKENFLFS